MFKRNKNVILFGLTQAATSTNEEDKKEVIKIFNSMGIVISNESIDIERLNPKRNQSGPRPILVKLNSTNLRADILKAAKLLKDQTEFKHISSPDLFIEQRLVEKKLIKMRKELNKEIKEHLPNAEFYTSPFTMVKFSREANIENQVKNA